MGRGTGSGGGSRGQANTTFAQHHSPQDLSPSKPNITRQNIPENQHSQATVSSQILEGADCRHLADEESVEMLDVKNTSNPPDSANTPDSAPTPPPDIIIAPTVLLVGLLAQLPLLLPPLPPVLAGLALLGLETTLVLFVPTCPGLLLSSPMAPPVPPRSLPTMLPGIRRQPPDPSQAIREGGGGEEGRGEGWRGGGGGEGGRGRTAEGGSGRAVEGGGREYSCCWTIVVGNCSRGMRHLLRGQAISVSQVAAARWWKIDNTCHCRYCLLFFPSLSIALSVTVYRSFCRCLSLLPSLSIPIAAAIYCTCYF